MAKSRSFGSNIVLLRGHESSILLELTHGNCTPLVIVITEIVLDFLFVEGIIVSMYYFYSLSFVENSGLVGWI
jgi:hypothetical protein